MSSTFWTELALALGGLVSAILLIRVFRSGALRDLRARHLRRRLVPKLQAILPVILSHLGLLAQGEAPAEIYRLFSLRADLEALLQEASVLFDQERVLLIGFLERLSSLTARFEAGIEDRTELSDLILVGQRAIHEMREIGL